MSQTESAETQQTQYLSFFIAAEEYALGILSVKEIIEYTIVTKLPSTPPAIRGVINLRGSVVPVVDLAVGFGLPESPVTKWTCIVMVECDVEGERTTIGIVVDSVSQVIDLLPSDIEPPPAFGTRLRTDFLNGMGKVGKKFVLILDLDRLLSTGELLSAAASTVRTASELAAAAQATEVPVVEGPRP